MNSQVKDVGMVIFAIVVVVVAFMGFPRVDNAVKSKAVSECVKAANSSAVEGGFNGAVYKICVEDSGYKSQIK